MNSFENGMSKLLLAQLADLYFCENQLVGALQKMADAAKAPELKKAFLDHRQETIGHVHRIETAFAEIRQTPKAFPCRALDGLLDDGKWMMYQLKNDPALDAALITAAQKVEMFEVASYRSAVRLAQQLGHEKLAELCQGILDEELAADEKLATIAAMGERQTV